MSLNPLERRILERKVRIHRPESLAAASANRTPASKRRSSRMALSAPVGLSGEDRHKRSFTASAKATNLNRHGAVVQLGRELAVGSVIIVNNNRGAELSARVVSQLTAVQGVSTYGIEFVEQDDTAKNFWGISFPSNA
jgi:PilZ domain-containing protein